MEKPVLSSEETKRYARHLVLKGFGGTAQQRLKSARVLVVGAGGLGSPALAYLAAAGVGTLGIADHDTVGLSNLQRQVVHTTAAVGTPKTQSARAFIAAINPNVIVETLESRLEADNVRLITGVFDIVLDGTDNFATRAIVAEACERSKKPLVSGAVSMFDGQVTTFVPGGPRFADLYPEAPREEDLPSCEVNGVLGPVTGVIGSLMAMEAIKLITGVGEPLTGRLLLYSGHSSTFTELTYERGAEED
ncbi:MAG TPA: molybdopterin-synthase adenylyltransferase MoeB [Devosia sp.]|nr:molybdopterin-synthase adenylyltransferase MoeB [Devosia sp.]